MSALEDTFPFDVDAPVALRSSLLRDMVIHSSGGNVWIWLKLRFVHQPLGIRRRLVECYT